MKIVIACDSFKESLSAGAVVDTIARSFRLVFPEAAVVCCPVADGGEGTVAALVDATGGRIVETTVTGPLGGPVPSFFGILGGDGRTAVIETAAAAGLELLESRERDVGRATTCGVGELILHALDAGCRHLILGLGGSATNDGGAGMAQALGARFVDGRGRALERGGLALAGLRGIDVAGLDPRLKRCVVEVACDVDNPLLGAEGASAVFGPQKGASPEDVRRLDAALTVYAERLLADLGRDVADRAGAGAAGGLGAGALAFLDARLRPGFEIVSEAVGLEALCADADLVITGEGRIDGQTLRGKTPAGVAAIAKRLGKPVIAFAGSLGPDVEKVREIGLQAVFGTTPTPCSLAEALANAEGNLERTARDVAAVLRLGSGL